MTDRKVQVRLSWINVFNLGGLLWGWCSSHTWEGAAWGFLAGTIGPPLFLIVCFMGALFATKVVDAWPMPKVRIEEQHNYRVEETQEARWEREYSQHCRDNNLPNELRTCQRQELYYAEASQSPIHREQSPAHDEHGSFIGTKNHGYTSSGGPG